MELLKLGWDEQWESAFASKRTSGFVPGRVAAEDKHRLLVILESGPVTGIVPGKLRRQRREADALPKVGDWVATQPVPNENKALVHEVLPRRTSLQRKTSGRDAQSQVLAANVDVVFVVQALDASLNLRRLERSLALAQESGAETLVLFNKCDVCEALAETLERATASIGKTPWTITSAKTGKGLGEIRERLVEGRTAVFLGSSGVGKSSLINRLYGEAVQETTLVRESDDKGRHTTTSRELILLPSGGLVIDTPGLREFHLWSASEGLSEAFTDVVAIAKGCRFRDCAHLNEPGCAVLSAIGTGSLDAQRVSNFRKLSNEAQTLGEQKRQNRSTGRSKPDESERWHLEAEA